MVVDLLFYLTILPVWLILLFCGVERWRQICVSFCVCRTDGDKLPRERAGSAKVSIDACGRNIVMKES
jgi:hypothetical protein